VGGDEIVVYRRRSAEPKPAPATIANGDVGGE